MRKLLAIFILICCFVMAGCKGGEAFEGEVNTVDGVSLTVLQDTVTRRTMTIQVLNTSKQQVTCGTDGDYWLQAEQGGRWYQVESGPFSITMEAYFCQNGVPVEQYINLEKRYKGLPAGQYRIVKECWIGQGEERQSFLLAGEFYLD